MHPMLNRFSIPLALVALLGASAPPNVIRLSSRADSRLTIEGGSNVHEWACSTSQIDASVSIDPAYATAPTSAIGSLLKAVEVKVPVRTIKCGKGAMDKNLYKALKADKSTTISYIMGSFTVAPGATAESFTVKAPGSLTIAGAQRAVTVEVKAVRQPDGTIKATGRVPLKMTDFGIEPPTAMFGAMKTKNDITVVLDLTLGQ